MQGLTTMITDSWTYDLLLFAAGIAAGVINTLAGSGSILTLSALVFAGLPASIANTTNRLGILMQGIVATFQYARHGKLYFRESAPIILPTILGSLLGGWVAIEVSEKSFEITVGIIMAVLMVMMLWEKKIKQWQQKILFHPEKNVQRLIQVVVFLLVGFYGGFIQAGIGLLLFVALAFTTSHDAVQSNGIKILLVLFYTIPVFIFFVLNHPIAWKMGIFLASGQMIGAWYASHYAIKSPHAGVWMKRLIILMAFVTVLKMFHLI